MSSSFPFRLVAALALVIGAASCSRAVSASGFETASLTIRTQEGRRVRVRVEVARSEEERALGLMFRTGLADGTGMFFVFERDHVLNFWMKNTLLPLSIAFIAGDGKIVDIQDMVPHSLETVRSRFPARYALEVPDGWFSREGIRVGDMLDTQSLPSK